MSIGKNIGEFRKRIGMTQAALGEKLGVSNQAVSKWEAETTMPDIMLLPDIVRILEVTLEELYGLAEKTEATKTYDLPWEDDGILRAVVFEGKRMVHTSDVEDSDRVVFDMTGSAKDIITEWNLVFTGNASGEVRVGRDLDLAGSVSGGANAGRDMNVTMGISGGAHAGRDLEIVGNITGDTAAGRDVSVSGDLSAGSVQATNEISATNVRAGTVMGDVSCTKLECEKVEGNVELRTVQKTTFGEEDPTE